MNSLLRKALLEIAPLTLQIREVDRADLGFHAHLAMGHGQEQMNFRLAIRTHNHRHRVGANEFHLKNPVQNLLFKRTL